MESSSRRDSAGRILEAKGNLRIRLGKAASRPPPRINDIVLERRGITADTALRLSRFFGTTEQFWLNLQDAYDIGRVKAELARELEEIEPLKGIEAGL